MCGTCAIRAEDRKDHSQYIHSPYSFTNPPPPHPPTHPPTVTPSPSLYSSISFSAPQKVLPPSGLSQPPPSPTHPLAAHKTFCFRACTSLISVGSDPFTHVYTTSMGSSGLMLKGRKENTNVINARYMLYTCSRRHLQQKARVHEQFVHTCIYRVSGVCYNNYISSYIYDTVDTRICLSFYTTFVLS